MQMTMKWMSFMALLLLLGGCGGEESSDSGESPSSQAAWTYMVYVAGDNNLATAAINDINEMETVGSSDKVNVVVEVEYSSTYTPTMPSSTLRGKIEKDNNRDVISSNFSSIGERDMGSKEELSDFVQWATTHYPADHYALVLWDHGAGWKMVRNTRSLTRGALQDESAGSFMSLPDLAGAIRESGVVLDLINFDACLMGMYEVAYEFKGLAKYISFSEEVEPGDGDPYDTILSTLVDTPDISAKELAVVIPQKYREYYQSSGRSTVTKSSVDLGYVEQLDTQLGALSDLFIQNIATERSYIQSARSSAVAYDYKTNIDLGDFIDRIATQTNNSNIKNKIVELKSTLNSMVIANEKYSAISNDPILDSTGLAIFVPQRSEVSEDDLVSYSQLAINTTPRATSASWGDFVNLLVSGDSDAGQSSLSTTSGNFSIWLEWDSDADLDLIIWEPNGEFAAPYIGVSSTNGFLSEDSATSGVSIEYYAAAEVVQEGVYDILVNYYDDGPSQNFANASLYFLDPDNGITTWSLLSSRYMDLSNSAPLDWIEAEATRDEVWNDVYSDWWWWYNSGYLNRNGITRSNTQTLSYKGENVSIKVHLNRLPAKNSYKNGLNIESDTALFIREELQSLREEMGK